MKKIVLGYFFLSIGLAYAKGAGHEIAPQYDVLTINVIGNNEYRSDMEVTLRADDDTSSISDYIHGAVTLRSHHLLGNPAPQVTELSLTLSLARRVLCIAHINPAEAADGSIMRWNHAAALIVRWRNEIRDPRAHGYPTRVEWD